jgi:hypothetical protein
MIDEFGHGSLFEGARYVFVGQSFSAIPLFPPLTRLFTSMYFFILAATLIILNNYFILTVVSYENNSTCKMTMMCHDH